MRIFKIFENGIFFSQQEIDRVLTRGSGFEEGKYRINQMFSKNTTLKEKVQFLKKRIWRGWKFSCSWFYKCQL